MEDKRLTEKESLEVITSMIARTKDRYLGSGTILLMWGYLVISVAIAVWALLAWSHHNAWNWLWFAIPVIGFPMSSAIARRQRREYGAVTYSDRVTSRLWLIFGYSEIAISLMCLGFYFLASVNCWGAMLAYTLLVAPAAEIAQGLIVKEKSLIAGGIVGLAIGMVTICCIACGITLVATWYMPLFIFAFVAMMIVPGHIIRNKETKK